MITQKTRYIDLHTHTFYSDGILTPTDNVITARINGIDFMAITDHDKTEGYEEAKRAGEKWQVQIVPGTEISTDAYHILGLGIDIYNPNFRKFMKISEEEQIKVCQKRIDGLRERGVPVSMEKMLAIFPNSRLGKMNLWYLLMQDRECQDYFIKREGRAVDKQMYYRYLKSENKQEVKDKLTIISPEMAIAQIHNAGGIAILAHPPLDIEDMAEMDVLLRQGLDGIEVQTRTNGKNKPFIEFAKKNNLLITYGSDYHGGISARQMLDNTGENILSEELARALKLEWN